MIGLGRMGSNMARRLMRAGHECVAFDFSAPAIKALAADGATAATSVTDLVAKLPAPRVVWMMVPAAAVDSLLQTLTPVLKTGDIVTIDARGHHLSDKPHDEPAYDEELFAADVLAVMDELKVDQAHYWAIRWAG